jgi:hypothetical protein
VQVCLADAVEHGGYMGLARSPTTDDERIAMRQGARQAAADNKVVGPVKTTKRAPPSPTAGTTATLESTLATQCEQGAEAPRLYRYVA